MFYRAFPSVGLPLFLPGLVLGLDFTQDCWAVRWFLACTGWMTENSFCCSKIVSMGWLDRLMLSRLLRPLAKLSWYGYSLNFLTLIEFCKYEFGAWRTLLNLMFVCDLVAVDTRFSEISSANSGAKSDICFTLESWSKWSRAYCWSWDSIFIWPVPDTEKRWAALPDAVNVVWPASLKEFSRFKFE